MDYSLLLGLCLVVSFIVFRTFKRNSKKLVFPPGPPPTPLIGNLLQLPKTYVFKTYAEWSKICNSDVISFTGLGKRVIVLNSVRAATDLLELRGVNYSDREHNVMLHDLLKVKNILSMSYDDTFRLHRKVMNTAMNPTAARNYHPTQEKETYALMARILEAPDEWAKHIRRTAGSIILSTTYAHEVTSDDDYLVVLAERAVNVIRRAIIPTSFLVNMLPALKHVPGWLPGVQFKRFANDARKLLGDLEDLPFQEVKKRIAAGHISSSYTTRLLEMNGSITGDPKVDEGLIKGTASLMYGAGSSSTINAITEFILALMIHPDVQKKAQAEIDAVIGTSRLPTLADKDSLPYFQMVLSESVRWMPVIALGVPHAAHQDDTYNGMFIPKGTVIIPNIWAMMHDERMYPEPERFWPERFDGRFPDARNPRSFTFGFNRRICPGRHIAINSLFIQAATLMAVFNLSKPRDEHGNEIEPTIDYSEGRLKPFKCIFTPRSAEAVAMVRSAAAATAA